MKRKGAYAWGLAALVATVSVAIYLAARRPIPAPETGPGPLSAKPAPHAPETPAAPELPPSSTPPPEAPPVANAPAAASSEDSPAKIAKRGPLKIPKGQSIPELFPFEKERTEINRLAANSGPGAETSIGAYLTHSDSAVRGEARNALLRLGSAAAAELLKQAATRAADAEEARALREAAEFLALATSASPASPPAALGDS